MCDEAMPEPLVGEKSSGLSKACTTGCLESDPNLKSLHWISEWEVP